MGVGYKFALTIMECVNLYILLKYNFTEVVNFYIFLHQKKKKKKKKKPYT